MKRIRRILPAISLIAIGIVLLTSICGVGAVAATAKKQRKVNLTDKIMLDSLQKLSGMMYGKRDYSETTRIKLEEEELVARMYGKTSDEYAELMMEISAVYYAQCSDNNAEKPQMISRAMDYMKKSMVIYGKLHGMNSPEYIRASSSYAYILAEADHNKYAGEILDIRRNNINSFTANGDTVKLGLENYAYGYNCCMAADSESDMEVKIKLLRDGIEAIKALPESSWYQGTRELVAEMYRRSGNAYFELGRAVSDSGMQLQLQYAIKANNMYAEGEKYGLSPVSRSYSDMSVASIYAGIGDSGKAVEILTALAARVEASGTNYLGENLASVYSGLGKVYDVMGNIDKSVEAYDKALEICGKPSKENGNMLSDIYYQLTGSLISRGKIKEGEKLIGDWKQVLDALFEPDGMEYASYLVRKARIEGVKGDVKQAFADSRQAYDITRRSFPADNIAAINVEKDMFQYSSVSHSNEWPLFFDRLLEHSSKYKIQNPNMYASMLIDGARAYRNSGQYLKALELTDEAIGICNSIPHDVNTHILGYQQGKATLLADMHRNEEALSLLDSIIASPAANRVVKKSSYKTRAEVLKTIGKYAEALADFRKSESFAEKGEAGDSQYNLSSLGFVASLYESMLLSDSAYQIRGKAADMAARLYGEGSSRHLEAQVKQHLTWRHENIQKVDSLMRRNLLILEADSAASPYNYYIECMNYGDTRAHLGDLKGAAKYIRKALDGIERLNSMEDESYHSMLTKGANIYFRMGDLETSSELAEKSLELTRRYHPYNLSRQLTALSWLIAADEKNTDYGSQLARHNEYVDLWNKQYGRDVFSDMGHNLAAGVIYSNLGDYGKTVEINERSLNVIDSIGLKESKYELSILSNLTVGMVPERVGDNAKLKLYADRLARCVDVQMEKEEESKKSDSKYNAEPVYIMGRPDTSEEDMQASVSTTLHNLSNAYFCLHDTTKSIRYGDALLQRPQVDKGILAKGKSRQGLHRVRLGRAADGRRLLDESMIIADTLFKRKSMGNYLYVVYDNIRGYDCLGDRSRRNNLALEYGRHIRKYVSDSFLTLTSANRTSFWNIYSPFLMDMFHGYVSEKSDTAMTRAGYDNLLLGKGLLLDTDRTIRQVVAESKDPAIKEAYESYKLNKLTLERYSKGGMLLPLDIDSLARVVANQEMYLAGNSGRNSENFNIGWRDVRKSLKAREAAVEFAEYQDLADTSANRHYMAYILRRDMESPEAVALTIPETAFKQRRNFPGMSEALWKPLGRYFENVSAVYFSPAGALHGVPMETLPDYENERKNIGDRWNLYRVSSTRNVKQREKRRLKDAVIYGGIKYDTDIAALQSDAELYTTKGAPVRNLEWLEDEYEGGDTLMRRGVAYLPGTLAEANDIRSILDSRNVITSMYTDSDGTEASFKALSGTNHDIIHIATHGFSLEEEKSRSRMGRLLTGDADATTMSYEDRVMARSGLMMAGANNKLKQREIPENVDDGILHSSEIAGMDLRNVDMVVMSACETGLGRTENEGVYGLQRAFKKAGVNAMVASLWPVNDEATSLLMKKFYEYIMQGKSKHEALAAAQKFLREETKYTQPRYWSAFILIDGLN